MPLGQDTRRALGSLRILLDLQRNIPITPGKLKKRTRAICTERIWHFTFGRLLICWIPTVPLLIGKTVCQAERILRNM
jgi:hypothetical protein